MDMRSEIDKAKDLLDKKKLREKQMKEMWEDLRWVICGGVILTVAAIGYGSGRIRIPNLESWLGRMPVVSASNQDLKMLSWKITRGSEIAGQVRNVASIDIEYAELHFRLDHPGGAATSGVAILRKVTPGVATAFAIPSKLPIAKARLERIRVR